MLRMTSFSPGTFDFIKCGSYTKFDAVKFAFIYTRSELTSGENGRSLSNAAINASPSVFLIPVLIPNCFG